MAGTLVAILMLTVLGLPLALLLDRSSRGPLLLGVAFLQGSGAMFLLLLSLSILRIPWTLLSVTATALLLWIAAWIAHRLRVAPVAVTPPEMAQPRFHWTDLASLVALAGYTIYATAAPLWEWDFWAIWALKARVFLEKGGVDWRFLESHWNAFAHPDYPLLLPLNFDFIALVNGSWSDRWLGFLFVAFGVALLCIARSLATRETTSFMAGVLTFALSSLAVSRYVGLSEGAVIAFGGAAVLLLRWAVLHDEAGAWRQGAVLLGFAANCKNEGLALLVAVAIALLLSDPRRWRRLFRLWPAVVLAAPWLLLRATHVLATDIAGGSVSARVLYRLRIAPQILAFLGARLDEPWFWVALLAAVLIAPAVLRRRESFVLLVTAIQLVFYIGAYFATPNDIRWHVATSWSRLTGQVAVPITYSAMLMLADFVFARKNAPHAEARPRQP